MAVIVHVGYPKTATSWLQQNFFPYVQNADFLGPNETFSLIFSANSFDFNINHIRSRIYPLKKEHLLISLENIIGTTHSFGFNGCLTAEYARRIQAVFPDAIILLFIRRQPDIIASGYMAYIKQGGTYKVQKYLYHKNFQDITGLSLFSFKHFEYHLILDFYQQLFGMNQIQVYLYEAFSENPKFFVQNMCQDLRLKADLELLNFSRVNIGYRKYIKYLALGTNHFTEHKILNKHYFFRIPRIFNISRRIFNQLNKYRIFGSFQEPIEILGENTYAYICDYYRDSNQKLISKFEIEDVKKYLYPL